jgi:copper chaperone CopZ
VIIVLIAVIGGVSFSYISASNQKSVSSDTKEYLSTNIEKSVSARTDSRQALPAGELKITDNISKAILRVDGMSCSGCIYTIKSSLAGIKGVRDILVNVADGQAEVYYDKEKFKANLEENGYAFDYFMKKFERRVLINKYLDDEIFNGVTDQFEKERLYTS